MLNKNKNAQSRFDMDFIVQHINRYSGRNEKRLDAGEAGMLELQLEDLMARVYEVQYEELRARRFLPIISDVDTGAEYFAFEQTDEVGEAKIITNYADDLPSVSSKTEKIRHDIVSLGDSWEWSIQDLRRAAFSGQPLEARKAKAARNAWERGLDSLAARGSAAHNIGGFINATGVEITAAVGAVWAGLDSSLILADVNKLVSEAIVNSKETITFNTLLLPTVQYLKISQTQMDTTSSRTVLEAIKASNPTITEIAPWNVLDGAGDSGKDRGILYAKSEEYMGLVIPQEFEVVGPQPKNLAFRMLGHGRTGGVAVFRPLGMRYIDGI